ncbi:SAM-dependent methyltransferase [Bacillus coahuilensis m2-6]|uniref:O-methyltransferase n=1 Tax=Bacillus coahuilensis TaxID=408580 RepID=UPI0001850774|nr:O-methyltransferase [Bacillus coahuilensis]KUP07279.1 SAM-dependent methyltransferase [Bacillus coahuilensis m2-6]
MKDQLHHYIEKLIPQRESFFVEMEEYAVWHSVPIMEIVGMEALLQLLSLQQPKKILEIGTAIGYSSLRMATSLPNVEIVTIERDEKRIKDAKKYLTQHESGQRIHLIEGDALEVSEMVLQHGPFDALFIDAAKGQYPKFFSLYAPMLKEEGVIYTDNVLFKGYVADIESIESRNKRSLVKKIHQYNEWLMNHEKYKTAILPVGDGLAITKKR